METTKEEFVFFISPYTPSNQYYQVMVKETLKGRSIMSEVVVSVNNVQPSDVAPLCPCGCGGSVGWNKCAKKWNKWIVGHTRKGKHCSEETRLKNSLGRKGKTKEFCENRNKNLPLCDCGCGERVRSYGDRYIKYHNRRGKHLSEEHKNKLKGTSWSKGKKLSEEHKRKLSIAMSGRIRTKEHSQNISKALLGKKYVAKTGTDKKIKRIRTKEHNRKIGESLKRTCLKTKGVEYYSQTPERREKARIFKIKQMEEQFLNNEPLHPVIGSLERDCLNIFQKYISYTIQRNTNMFKYTAGAYPDGFIQEFNLVIEFDELRHHFIDKECKIYTDKDIARELSLASQGLIIFRITEKDWKEDQSRCIDRFKMLIEELKVA